MGGLTFEKLLIIGAIALIIVGPERLPRLAAQAAELVKRMRGFADDAKARVESEFGEDFSAEDWRKLDPRQYDPRRIFREAWEEAGAEPRPDAAAGTSGSAQAPAAVGAGALPTVSANAASPNATGPAASAPAWATMVAVDGASTLHFDDEAT